MIGASGEPVRWNGVLKGMTLSRLLPLSALAATLVLAACQRETVNPPTEPADPIPVPVEEQDPGPGKAGATPATFVGRWAARSEWCANTSGPEQAITISTLRFEGYENSCAISSLDQVTGGYEATLACESEGTASRERVRLAAQGDGLRLTWLDRDDAAVQLVRCPVAPEPTG